MKRTISLLLVLCFLAMTLFACGETENVNNSSTDSADTIVTSTVEGDETSNGVSNADNSETSSETSTPRPTYKKPENVLYNTSEKEYYGYHWSWDGRRKLWFANDNHLCLFTGGDRKLSQLENYVEEYKGDSETWFYVAFNVNSRIRQKGLIPNNDMMAAESEAAVKYLLSIGFIPDYDHRWSYTNYLDGTSEYVFWYSVVGYVTADMLLAINDPHAEYVVMQLPENDNLDTFLEDIYPKFSTRQGFDDFCVNPSDWENKSPEVNKKSKS